MSGRLVSKVAVVTGAARNNGLGIARRFCAEGARVAILDVLPEATAAAEGLRNDGFDAVALKCDVSQKPEVDEAFVTIEKRLGPIDILVNNAGIGGLGSQGEVVDVAEADFDRVMKVNVKSVILCSQAAARSMLAHGRQGSIINISSINAIMMSPGQLSYATSKGAISSATKVLAVALAEKGIRVNAIAPGSILNDNSGHQHTFSERRKMVLARIPMGRLGTPSDVSGVAMFFATEDSSYVTGQVLYMDGGRSCLNYMTDFPFDMEGSRPGMPAS